MYCSAHALVDTNIQVEQHRLLTPDPDPQHCSRDSTVHANVEHTHSDTEELRDSTACCRTDTSRAAQYAVEQTRPEAAKASVGQKLYRRLCSFAVYSSHPVRNIILETLTGIQNGSTVR
jgi:hypothetical protein